MTSGAVLDEVMACLVGGGQDQDRTQRVSLNCSGLHSPNLSVLSLSASVSPPTCSQEGSVHCHGSRVGLELCRPSSMTKQCLLQEVYQAVAISAPQVVRERGKL